MVLPTLVTVAALLAAACGGASDEPFGPAISSGPATTGIRTPNANQTGSGSGTTSAGPGPTADSAADGSTADDDGTATGNGEGGDDETTEVAEPSPDEQPLPATAAELAADLSEVELALRSGLESQDETAPWGRRQQQLYRILNANEAWYDEVLAAVDPQIQSAVASNWDARQNLDLLLATETVHTTLPAWRIVEPAPASELLGYYQSASAETGVPWEVLAAINLVETRMGRIRGVSTAGAVGPMQFLPTTWAECCTGDPTLDRDAIHGAAQYLVDRGAATYLDGAIWGYNNSDYYVNAVQSYAAVMAADEAAYYGYHAWDVWFRSTEGIVLLPIGYEELEEVDAAAWVAENPQYLISAS